jgi:hypothetical protein
MERNHGKEGKTIHEKKGKISKNGDRGGFVLE